MKKICIVLCLCLAALLVLPGCAGEKQLTRVRLSEVTHSVFYAPQYVAMSQGFFRQEGLEVELTNGGGADKVMTAVVSGQADMGLAGPEAAIYVMNQGKEDHPVIFAQLTKRDGSFLVGREPGPFSWEDVRGRTIIGGRAGGVPEMTLEYVLRQRGIEPQRDAVVDTSVQFNMMAGAFTGGNGDYVTLFEPTATEVEQAGKGYILCSIGQESGEIPYTAYFANRSYVEANPETVQGFVNAMALAQQWVAEHTDRQVAEAICGQFPDTDLDVLERVCARHREIDAWNRTPVMEQQALERLETVMTQAGELSPDRGWSVLLLRSPGRWPIVILRLYAALWRRPSLPPPAHKGLDPLPQAQGDKHDQIPLIKRVQVPRRIIGAAHHAKHRHRIHQQKGILLPPHSVLLFVPDHIIRSISPIYI